MSARGPLLPSSTRPDSTVGQTRACAEGLLPLQWRSEKVRGLAMAVPLTPVLARLRGGPFFQTDGGACSDPETYDGWRQCPGRLARA